MRGKAGKNKAVETGFGITPAYAGKSPKWFVPSSKGGDHPRLCGEKDVKKAAWYLNKGSPPPMRGKVICTCKHMIKNRITPAYAGKRHNAMCR